MLLVEPELHLGPLPDIVVPDIAGWRRERVPAGFMQDVSATLPPDWLCEVLSRSTEARDRDEKLTIYHREGVAHVWLVSPTLRTVEVFRRGPSTRCRSTSPGCGRCSSAAIVDGQIVEWGAPRLRCSPS